MNILVISFLLKFVYGVTYYEIKAGNELCLDADAGNVENDGCEVQLWTCNGQTQQKWYYDYSTKAIKNEAGGLCLDVHQPDLYNNGGEVQLWTCNGETQQQWTINSNNQIVSGGGKCLDVHLTHYNNNNDGATVQIWECLGTSQLNQIWTIITPSPTPSPTVPSNCIDVEGSQSGDQRGDQSVAECPSSGDYTQYVSCGISSSSDISYKNIGGIYMEYNEGSIPNGCYAEIAVSGFPPSSGSWVKAHARCCKLYDAAYYSDTSSPSSFTSSMSCPGALKLTGCQIISDSFGVIGSYPDEFSFISNSVNTFYSINNQKCVAEQGESSVGVEANAICSSGQLECGYIFAQNTVECPSDYFISGCSTYEPNSDYTNSRSWYINNNKCITENKTGSSGSYAMAICCKEI